MSWLDDAIRNGLMGKTQGINLDAMAAAASKAVVLTPEAAESMAEATWQKTVQDFAVSCGWTCYHTRDSRGSDFGFCDLVMAKLRYTYPMLIFAELKREDGIETPEQCHWRNLLTQINRDNPRVLVTLWRPSHWEMVKKTLS